jgi:hypothetical protein
MNESKIEGDKKELKSFSQSKAKTKIIIKRRGLKMTDLTKIEKVAQKFDNDLEKIGKELKRIQSIKCRLKKQKGKKTYQEEMTEVVRYEQVLKEARQLLNPKKKPVTKYTQEDIDQLDYDETVKAIRSIQSKKTLTKWLTDVEGDNDEYRKACEIEKMLIEHRKNIKPIDDEYIRKTDLQKIIDTIEESGQLSQEKIINLLKSLI